MSSLSHTDPEWHSRTQSQVWLQSWFVTAVWSEHAVIPSLSAARAGEEQLVGLVEVERRGQKAQRWPWRRPRVPAAGGEGLMPVCQQRKESWKMQVIFGELWEQLESQQRQGEQQQQEAEPLGTKAGQGRQAAWC